MIKSRKLIRSFPWIYFFLCIFIILLARLDIIGVLYGFTFRILKFRASVVVIEMILMLIPLILYFIVIYFGLKSINASKRLCVIMFLLPGILLGVYSLYFDLPQVKAAGTLSVAGLAPLPKSAHDLKVFSFDLGIRANWNLWFKATPADIKSFLEQSPALKDVESTDYSKERMRLVEPPGYRPSLIESNSDGHDYFYWDNNMPSWYKVEVKQAGRKYLYDHNGYDIRLVVDEKEGIVLVYVNWG